MGQEISQAHTPPPLTLRDCIVNGKIDLTRYRLYSRRVYENKYEDSVIFNSNKRKQYETESKARKKIRSVKRHHIQVPNKDGTLRSLTFKDSAWYNLYINSPQDSNRQLKIFRRRFRLPYDLFLNLVADIKEHEYFVRWMKRDCIGNEPSDIRLLLLGTLRYLGRALTFHDIEVYSFISAEVHRNFFKSFREYGSEVLYQKYVVYPASKQDASTFERLFALAGFNGCIGSADGTHVGMLRCPSWASINHTGHKLAIPSRNYNATVTHSHQILNTTCGHPGTWNDKTLIMYDELIRGVKEGRIYSKNVFKLFELDKNKNEVQVTYQGAWFIVDNGYLDWSCTVPPMKDPVSYEQIRFSEWLESIRKDVECTFGSLKQRFAVLRYGIRLAKIADCDKIWRTCCSLHNLLLFNDKLDMGWEDEKKTYERDCADGDNDGECYDEYDDGDVPFALTRLKRLSSSSIPQNYTEYDDNYFDKYTVENKRQVAKLPLKIFQERLIHHFDIRFKKNDIQWPNRKLSNSDV
jgi:hypothetical protein